MRGRMGEEGEEGEEEGASTCLVVNRDLHSASRIEDCKRGKRGKDLMRSMAIEIGTRGAGACLGSPEG
jgi:hypothetical protein